MAQPLIVEEPIREFVLKSFPLARKKGITASEKWLESGVLDSLGILDLVHFLEERFFIQISDEELLPENFESFASVAEFAQRKIASRTTLEGEPCS
jgi:acyl carrier protein